MNSPARITDVLLLHSTGPWLTKSNAQLTVPFAMTPEEVREYMHHEPTPEVDIRGFRIYFVLGVGKGAVGGKEYHRVRKEYAFTVEGCLRWTCEDLWGASMIFEVPVGKGLYIPPNIMHTVEGLMERNSLVHVANTLYDPDDPRTHDTYVMDAFRQHQADYC